MALWKAEECIGYMLIPRNRQGGRLAITRSSVPTLVGIGWASQRSFAPDLHQMQYDLAGLLLIGGIGNQFTLPFGRSNIKIVCTSTAYVQTTTADQKSGSAP